MSAIHLRSREGKAIFLTVVDEYVQGNGEIIWNIENSKKSNSIVKRLCHALHNNNATNNTSNGIYNKTKMFKNFYTYTRNDPIYWCDIQFENRPLKYNGSTKPDAAYEYVSNDLTLFKRKYCICRKI